MVRLTLPMRLLSVLAACTVFIAFAGAKPIANPTSDVSFNDKRSYLEKRVTTGTVCSTIPVTVPGNIVTGVIVSA